MTNRPIEGVVFSYESFVRRHGRYGYVAHKGAKTAADIAKLEYGKVGLVTSQIADEEPFGRWDHVVARRNFQEGWDDRYRRMVQAMGVASARRLIAVSAWPLEVDAAASVGYQVLPIAIELPASYFKDRTVLENYAELVVALKPSRR